jgi:hypothetical protein
MMQEGKDTWKSPCNTSDFAKGESGAGKGEEEEEKAGDVG